MIAIVRREKGIGKIIQYKVAYDSGWGGCEYFFVSHGVKGEDLLRHRLGDSGLVVFTWENNNIKAMFEEYLGMEIKCIKKVWG